MQGAPEGRAAVLRSPHLIAVSLRAAACSPRALPPRPRPAGGRGLEPAAAAAGAGREAKRRGGGRK